MKVFTSVLSLMCFVALSQAATPQVYGVWKSQVDAEEKRAGYVHIYKCGGKICGKIVQTSVPNAVDRNNGDRKLRHRKVKCLTAMTGYQSDSKGRIFTGGKAYSPNRGKTYNSELRFDPKSPNKLKVIGKILFFSKTQTWTRAPSKLANKYKRAC